MDNKHRFKNFAK